MKERISEKIQRAMQRGGIQKGLYADSQGVMRMGKRGIPVAVVRRGGGPPVRLPEKSKQS